MYGSHDTDTLDTVRVTNVDAAFRLFFSVSREFALEATTQRVLLRVVELATELGAQGREGKPVGALCVVGDSAPVAPHCQQMLMNPFKDYDARHRNILDPGLTETVKELSRMDGAFVVSGEGVIESAAAWGTPPNTSEWRPDSATLFAMLQPDRRPPTMHPEREMKTRVEAIMRRDSDLGVMSAMGRKSDGCSTYNGARSTSDAP